MLVSCQRYIMNSGEKIADFDVFFFFFFGIMYYSTVFPFALFFIAYSLVLASSTK